MTKFPFYIFFWQQEKQVETLKRKIISLNLPRRTYFQDPYCSTEKTHKKTTTKQQNKIKLKKIEN